MDIGGKFKPEALDYVKVFSNICIKPINMSITIILTDSGKSLWQKKRGKQKYYCVVGINTRPLLIPHLSKLGQFSQQAFLMLIKLLGAAFAVPAWGQGEMSF